VHPRRHRPALPAHVARTIGPSPARAEPHDAAAWFPVPDPHGLPAIELLLVGGQTVDPGADTRPNDATRFRTQRFEAFDAGTIDLTAIEAVVSPSPARAEPHDAAAWLPLDDLEDLPSIEELLAPTSGHPATVVAEAEAVVAEALAAATAAPPVGTTAAPDAPVGTPAPSPARAEAHDPSSWFPLPSPDELPPVTELLEARPPARTVPPRRTRLLPAPRVLGVAVLVVLTALGGAWSLQRLTAPAGSQITLLVDGTRRDMRSDASTVGALLRRESVHLASDDVVLPSATSSLHDGLHIDVLRAFPVSVDIDGTVRTVRTVETSADKLAKQLKLGKLTALRGEPGRLMAGSSVVFRTRVTGSLKLDNQTVAYDSPSRTVDELLESYNVTLVGDDYVTPAYGTVLHDGDQVNVVRVGAEMTQQTKRTPFATVQQPDPTLAIGQTRTIQEGVQGTTTVTYRQRVENGTKGERQVVSEVPTVAATPRIVGYGTAADWHWDELARCESGGRWDTVDVNPNGYDGGLGIYRGTWRTFGGTEFAPNAGLATREQQIIVAQRIYEKYGWDPWGCANNVLHWPQWSM
jgi:uncharacterized protein YabE (DUF348 family)